MTSPGFLRFFWEQELWDILLLSALVAVTYTGLLFLSLWILKRFVPGLQVRTLMVAVSLALGLFVVGFTTVNSVSHYLRFDPPGSGFERSTASYQQFAFWAKTAVVAVYAAGCFLWLPKWAAGEDRPGRWPLGRLGPHCFSSSSACPSPSSSRNAPLASR